MKLVFVPPFTFAHRVYLEAGEHEIKLDIVREQFGPGSGGIPSSIEQRWMKGSDSKMSRMNANRRIGTGTYYGFRTADDAVLFLFMHSGKK